MMSDDKFLKIKNEIKKGQIRYSIKSIFPILIAVIIGRFIGAYSFGNDNDIDTLWEVLPIIVILFSALGGIFSAITWHFKIANYKKELNHRNKP